MSGMSGMSGVSGVSGDMNGDMSGGPSGGTPPELLTVRVVSRAPVASGVCALTLAALDGAPLPAFTAGAHVDVHLPGGLVRQYSICSDPGERHRYVLGVALAEDSRGGSRAVHDQVREGAILRIGAPRNLFALADGAGRQILIAGGIGITPLLAMARQLVREGRDFELHYAARSAERMAFRDEIAQGMLSRRTRFYLSEGVGSGRLDVEAVLAGRGTGDRLYVCGPRRLIDAVLEAAPRHGWPAEAVHHESFTGAVPTQGEDRAFEIELASSGRVIPVLAHETAAQALIAQGVPLMTSCEQGVCGTCLTPVLAGEPDHRDSYLTPEERAANDQFTPCCSRARSARLVIDL